MTRQVAVVTGPTAGLGTGFAERLARDGHDLVLVARDAQRLERLADALRSTAKVDVEVFVADLAVAADRSRVAERLSDGVQMLVNNAGLGTAGAFWSADEALLRRQLDVNVTAVMELTRAALPPMMEQGCGTVLNVSSVAVMLRTPGTTYSASKAWVVAFSEGLAHHVAGSGVAVHVVCPGLVRTEFFERAGIDMSATPDKAWLTVPEVVDETMAAVERGITTIVPGRRYRFMTHATRVLPPKVMALLSKDVRKGPRK